MRGDTFHSLSFLDQILSAEVLLKKFQTFLEVKIALSLIKMSLGGVLKMSIFLAFIFHANEG